MKECPEAKLVGKWVEGLVCECGFSLFADVDKKCPRCGTKVCISCREKPADCMGSLCMSCDHLSNEEKGDD